MKTRKGLKFFLLGAAVVFLTGCGEAKDVSESDKISERVDTGFVLTSPDSFDSEDTCVVSGLNREESKITFLNLDLGKNYTLEYDKTTTFTDKYGGAVTINSIEEGNVVDVTFLKDKKHLTSLKLSESARVLRDVTGYTLDNIKKEITIGAEVYKLGKYILYLSDGNPIDPMEIMENDVIDIETVDKEVLSLSVKKGHGYLRLANAENFLGGWIEVGQSVITTITDDMILTVPEGKYDVTISLKGSGGKKTAIINRNQETTLDIGDLHVEEAKYGKVIFAVTPSDATIYLDGTEADISVPVELTYGVHQLIARAPGYSSIVKYLSVGEESATVVLDLEKSDGEDDEEEEDSVSGGNSDTNTDTITTYYKVYIDAPEGAEVYLDGNYIGISPCSFKKVDGTHVITLRKTGFETRSYTVTIENEEKDFSYSFADLVKSE
ncbi:MAG: PEGA domain-containing protein [Lachnospiraceae bacterium]|nr:PEGA domain-containing protein [Lachnospiraceae bacterium]